jgi:hypothetical protein
MQADYACIGGCVFFFDSLVQVIAIKFPRHLKKPGMNIIKKSYLPILPKASE